MIRLFAVTILREDGEEETSDRGVGVRHVAVTIPPVSLTRLASKEGGVRPDLLIM